MAADLPSGSQSNEMRPPPAPPDPNLPKKRGRGRPRKNSAASDDSMSGYSGRTSNRYNVLTDDDTGDDFPRLRKRARVPGKDKTSSKPPSQPRVSRPPPFIIKNASIVTVDNLIAATGVDKNNTRKQLTQNGIKLFVSTNDEFDAIRKKLDLHNAEHKGKGVAGIHFFTHAKEEERMQKYVLYGLPEQEIPEIESALAAKEIKPTLVKKMSIKNARYDGQANYLVYFERRSGIKLGDVQQVRGLLGYVVKWAHFSSRSSNITQCSNCQELGHGAKHCAMPPKCLKCSESHSSKDCPLNDPKSGKIPDAELKCALCGGNHTARFKDCPKRVNFIDLRKKMQSKGTSQQLPRYNYKATITPPQRTAPFETVADVLKRAQAPSTSQLTADLYSTAECMQIFNEIFSALSGCKSKADQIYQLTTIALKYIPVPTNHV